MIRRCGEVNLYHDGRSGIGKWREAIIALGVFFLLVLICTRTYYRQMQEVERLRMLNVRLCDEEARLLPVLSSESSQAGPIARTIDAMEMASRLQAGIIQVNQVAYKGGQISIEGSCKSLSDLAVYLKTLQQSIPGYWLRSLRVDRENEAELCFCIDLKEQ